MRSGTAGTKNENYWLSVNRLVNNKRIEIQLEAFAQLPDERLIIVASYEKGLAHFEKYRAEMERIKPPNVEIRNWVDDETLAGLYGSCKGFITTARDEDFGMTAVEAMAAGKFVIAPDEGGYRESVINGETGILIDDIDAEKVRSAVIKINALQSHSAPRHKRKTAEKCRENAFKFDTCLFIGKIRKIVTEKTVSPGGQDREK